MTIVTKAPKRDIYVKVWPSGINSTATSYSGRVGKVVSEGPSGVGQTIVIVDIAGESERKVFNGCDLDLITKKQYFKAALRGE